MNKKAKNLLAIMALISIIFIVNLGWEQYSPLLSSPSTKLFVDPETIDDPALAPGSRFWINVSIFNVTDMARCDFNLSFNPTILVTTGVLVQPVQGQYPLSYVDANSGKGYAYAELNYTTPVTLLNIKAALLRIQFTVKDYGITVLDLHDTILKDSGGHDIPHDVGDGLVRITKHDVAVTGVSVSPTETYPGRIVNITITVKNEGNTNESFTLSIFANDDLIGTFSVVDLQPDETRDFLLSWNTTGFAPSVTLYTIKSEASAVTGEKNLLNNVGFANVRIKITGDVNGDDVVDINDLIAWDSVFGTKIGDTNWNPQADINGNGTVDQEDGILIVQNYHGTP
jgi:hypothetical protein